MFYDSLQMYFTYTFHPVLSRADVGVELKQNSFETLWPCGFFDVD